MEIRKEKMNSEFVTVVQNCLGFENGPSLEREKRLTVPFKRFIECYISTKEA